MIVGRAADARVPGSPPSMTLHRSILLPALVVSSISQAAENQPVKFQANPLPLSAVRLTGGPLKHAQDLDAAYLLELEPDRMLHHLRERAGLKPKSQQGYGGWDGGGRQLTGHIAGHYLSAVSLMFAATGDARFKERADDIVNELAEIQKAQGDGYIGGLMAEVRKDGKKELVDGKQRFEDLGKGIIESGGFDLNGMWSPWYVQHKLYAGLRDAYRFTGNKQALEVEVKFAEWADRILTKLTPEQIQKMLATEFGAMNEIMADLYADTGDERWKKAYKYFEHEHFVGNLSQHKDVITRTHGNTQVPKLYGDLAYHIHTGDVRSGEAAKYFWDLVAQHYSFATGGHGKDEYFGEADKLDSAVDGRTAETCNVYNMLKFSRTLFALKPDVRFAEFQERALFNHILASIDDKDGRVCYMVPVGRGVTREYQGKFDSFTCCVGTGMESHTLHGDGVYYQSGDKLWVNLYTPSTADWATMKTKVEVETDFPEGESVRIRISPDQKKPFTLALRRPSWAGEGFTIQINGKPLENPAAPGNHIELKREWTAGDVVELKLPKKLRLEPTPDNPKRTAILWGPLVLAGDLGEENRPRKAGDDLTAVPVFVTGDRDPSEWIKPVSGKPGSFLTSGAGRERDVVFTPFYRLHRRTYAVYWDLFSPEEWREKEKQIAADREAQRKLEEATVAFAQPGEMQSERDFKQDGEDSEPYRLMGRAGRRGKNWFSFEMPVDETKTAAVVVTYNTDEWRKRTFDLSVDGKVVGQQVVEKDGKPPRFFDVKYPLPAELIAGKKKITFRFQATQGNEIACVFGIRTIRDGEASK